MSEADFLPVRVSTLRGDIKIPFDIYVRVAGKYIHYCRAGESFEGLRLARLKAKKLKKMFIRPEDQIPYEQYLEQSIDSAFDPKSNKSLDVRCEVIQGFEQAAAEQFMDEVVSEFAYNHVRSAADRLVKFLYQQPMALQSFLKIENSDASVSHHCVNVATLATYIALSSEQRESPQLPLLALGALLHDIDHMDSGFDVTKPLKTLTKDEMEFYRDHPLRGAGKIQTVPFADQLVRNIILQHEENMDGTGFPKKMLADHIDPLVFFVSTANAYDRLVSFNKMAPKDAMKSLLIDKMGQVPLNLLQTLQTVLKNAGQI